MSKTIIAQNKKARHDYYIEDTIEAGIVLSGTEVKSIRLRKVNLKDSYVSIRNGEAWVRQMHISPYEKGNMFNKDPIRERKLLMKKREIVKLIGLTAQKGYALIPLTLYLSGSLVKMEVAVSVGKKLYDKRAVAAERSAKRDMERAMKGE